MITTTNPNNAVWFALHSGPTPEQAQRAAQLGIGSVERLGLTSTCEEVLQNRLHPELRAWDPRPVAVVIYPRSDPNGAFRNSPVPDLVRGHRVLYYEAGSNTEMIEAMRDAARSGPAALLFLGGHGEPARLVLGNAEDPEGCLDLADEAKLRGYFNLVHAHGAIVLDSCSVGEGGPWRNNLANMVARLAPHATVFAPMVPTNGKIVTDAWGRFVSPGFTCGDRQTYCWPAFGAAMWSAQFIVNR